MKISKISNGPFPKVVVTVTTVLQTEMTNLVTETFSFTNRNDKSSDRNNRSSNSSSDISGDRPSEWDSVLNAYTSFVELETFVDSLPNTFLKPIKCHLHKFNILQHTVDEVARLSLTCDHPHNFIPVGDGNCLP